MTNKPDCSFVGVPAKPSLKLVHEKDGDVLKENKVIQFMVTAAYDPELWAFLAERAGEPLTVTVEPHQHQMFNKRTGEVR